MYTSAALEFAVSKQGACIDELQQSLTCEMRNKFQLEL